MLKKLLLLFSFLLLLTETSQSESKFDQSNHDLRLLFKNVHQHVLGNGLTILVYPRPNLGPVFSGTVNVRVGGVDEPIGKSGIAHMLEHMAFMGTPEIGTSDYVAEKELLRSLEEIAKEQQQTGLLTKESAEKWSMLMKKLEVLWDVPSLSMEVEKRGGSGLNASTDKDLTRYFVNLPINSLEFWFWLESERLFNPVMRKFYSERDVVLEERKMRSEDSPTGRLWERLMLETFDIHPYRHPVIGYEADIRQLLAEETRKFHLQYYVPSNMVVTVVGNVDVQQVFRLAEKYFGAIESSAAPVRKYAVEPEMRTSKTVNVDFDAEPSMAIVYRIPAYPHPDSAAIEVLLELLLGNRLTPLQKILVEQLQQAQSVGTFDGPGAMNPMAQVFWITPRSPYKPKEVLSSFDGILKQARFSENELQVAKRSIQLGYLSGLSSNYAIGLALAKSQIFNGDWRHVVYHYDALQAVTLEDVDRVLDIYFKNKPRIVGVVGREETHIQ